MNKNIYIYLIILINYLITISNGQVTKGNITITSLVLSSNQFNISLPSIQSTTFTFNFTYSSSLPAITGGSIYADDDDYNYAEVTFSPLVNFYNQVGDSYSVDVCVSSLSFEDCFNYYDSELDCNYGITFSFAGEDNDDVDFTNSELLKVFTDATLTVVQNQIDPRVDSLNVYVHPDAPLLTFEFEISYFGSGLSGFHFTLYSSDDDYYGQTVTVDSFITLNGKYYAEVYVLPGQTYTMDDLHLIDLQNNEAYYYTDDIEELFNFTSISTAKTDPIEDFFAYQLMNITRTIYSNVTTILEFDVYLNDYTYPILDSPIGDIGNCKTWYQNSTFVKLICTLYPFQESVDDDFEITSTVDTYSQTMTYPFVYKNLNTTNPIISSVSYTFTTIDDPKPVFMESNFTFTTYGAYLSAIETIGLSSSASLDNLVSGTISNGVLSVTWLIDPYTADISPYYAETTDSKGNEKSQTFYGPEIKVPSDIFDEDITVRFSTIQTVFDLSTNGIATIPFIIYVDNPTLEIGQYISSSYFDIAYDDDGFNDHTTIPSGSIAHFEGLAGGLLYTNKYTSLYQTWASIINSADVVNQYRGDFNLNFAYTTPTSDSSKHIYLTNKCFTIYSPDIQPTMITNFTFSPSNPINFTNSLIVTFTIETKGDNVEAAAVIFYQSDQQQKYLYTNPIANCTNVNAWNPNSLVATFTCDAYIPSLPSTNQALVYYVELLIRGIPIKVQNSLLRESGFPSYIQTLPQSDNGIASVTLFETSFNTSDNTISVNYSIEGTPYVTFNYPIEFHIFDIDQPDLPSIPYHVFSPSGQFFIELCQLPEFKFRYQNIGIYISVPSTINSVDYQTPYNILKGMDPNSQNFTLTPLVCDFSAPRIVDIISVNNPSTPLNTDNGPVSTTFYFDITDDISGFSFLEGTIKSNSTEIFFISSFNLTTENLISGNARNGRYQLDITVPQYANATFVLSADAVFDNRGNFRPYTLQNSVLFSNSANQFTAVATQTDPNIPTLTGVSNDTESNLYFEVQGSSTQLQITLTSDFITQYFVINAEPLTGSTYSYELVLQNTIQRLFPGTYYFSVCIQSASFTTLCYPWNDLSTLGFINSITINNWSS